MDHNIIIVVVDAVSYIIVVVRARSTRKGLGADDEAHIRRRYRFLIRFLRTIVAEIPKTLVPRGPFNDAIVRLAHESAGNGRRGFRRSEVSRRRSGRVSRRKTNTGPPWENRFSDPVSITMKIK